MKRVAAMLLAAVMLLGLCACGGVSEEDARAIELYNKYAHIIDRLENEDYTGVIQEMVGLTNSGKEQEEKTPMAQQMVGQWYLASGEDASSPESFSVSGDGTVTVGGTVYTFLEGHSADSYVAGFLLKDGVHAYALDVCKDRDAMVPYAQLWTVETEGDQIYSDDWVGTYYNQPMLAVLLKSWSNLDNYDETMPGSFYVNNSNLRVNDIGEEWAVSAADETSITVESANYICTVETRNQYAIGLLTDKATGNTASYYSYDIGYDRSWPEFIYPRAVNALNECLKDVAEGYEPGFWDSIAEEGESYYGSDAWQYLSQLFTQLGTYKDSAQLAARFSVLKEMPVAIKVTTEDHMGNVRNGELDVREYNSKGQVVKSDARELFRLYGISEGSTLYFFYDEAGRVAKVQRGSGNSVSAVVTPVYDGEGRMVSASYQNNSVSREFSYLYDGEGRMTQSTVWDGSYRYQFNYTYDDRGLLTQCVCWYGWNEPDYNSYRYTYSYSYDANGFLIQETAVEESYNSYNKTFTRYDSCTIDYTNDSQGRHLSATVNEVDNSGKSSYVSMVWEFQYQDLYFFD